METVEQATVSEMEPIPAAVIKVPEQMEMFKGDVGKILREAVEELKRAKARHPRWPVHIVARAGIVCEEAGELIRAALNLKYESNTAADDEQWKKEMEKEAIQVIATSIRFIESLRK
jgi:NTP pyrophosphatase (non-canonical NTP hydrolase)